MSYSANNNQNYFIKNGKSTSRVLAPPGGKSSICIGMDDEPEPPKKKKTVVPPVQGEFKLTNTGIFDIGLSIYS